jgi:hypothetical protein
VQVPDKSETLARSLNLGAHWFLLRANATAGIPSASGRSLISRAKTTGILNRIQNAMDKLVAKFGGSESMAYAA